MSRRSLILLSQTGNGRTKRREDSEKMVGGSGGMQDGARREISNTAIYSPRVLRVSPSGPSSTLDFAVRICGMSVAGTRPSGFLIAKRIRRDRGGSGSPPRKPALGTLSPPTGLDSFERAGDESSESLHERRVSHENFSRLQSPHVPL